MRPTMQGGARGEGRPSARYLCAIVQGAERARGERADGEVGPGDDVPRRDRRCHRLLSAGRSAGQAPARRLRPVVGRRRGARRRRARPRVRPGRRRLRAAHPCPPRSLRAPPVLVKGGFGGEVVATGAARDLARHVQLDAAGLQAEGAKRIARQRSRRAASLRAPTHINPPSLRHLPPCGTIAPSIPPVDAADAACADGLVMGELPRETAVRGSCPTLPTEIGRRRPSDWKKPIQVRKRIARERRPASGASRLPCWGRCSRARWRCCSRAWGAAFP